jgi:hypothetical protein
MTTETELSENPARAWQPEKFSEPRTFPEKWDFSAFDSPPAQSSDGGSPHPPAGQSDGSDVAEEESLDGWQPDPFPEPRTFPSKWDLSSLI